MTFTDIPVTVSNHTWSGFFTVRSGDKIAMLAPVFEPKRGRANWYKVYAPGIRTHIAVVRTVEGAARFAYAILKR